MNKTEIIGAQISLDDLKYSLQQDLSTRQLADFAISLGNKLTDEEKFYKLLLKRCPKDE